MNYGRISPRRAGMIIDAVHVLFGIVAIVMGIFAISDPQKYKGLFPLIFLLASLINFATSWYEFKMFPRIRKKTLSAWIYLITGLLIFSLFAVAAVSIWGNP